MRAGLGADVPVARESLREIGNFLVAGGLYDSDIQFEVALFLQLLEQAFEPGLGRLSITPGEIADVTAGRR